MVASGVGTVARLDTGSVGRRPQNSARLDVQWLEKVGSFCFRLPLMALTEQGKRSRKFHYLETQLGIANSHLYLYRKIRMAQKKDRNGLFYRSKDFWDYTLRGQIQSAVGHLCRIYDKTRDAFHLIRFLNDISPASLAAHEVKDYERDLKFCCDKSKSSSVHKLRMLRNKIFAHQDLAWIIEDRERLLKQYGLSLPEIQRLVDAGFEIISRWGHCYKSRFDRSTYPLKKLVSGVDDYRFVLESLALNSKEEGKR